MNGYRSRENSPVTRAQRYSCKNCGALETTRAALRKHQLNCIRISGKEEQSDEFNSSSSHVAQGIPVAGRKRNLALQRVRYRYSIVYFWLYHSIKTRANKNSREFLFLFFHRYEREEYRCSLCSYACTIEKAFERHLRAHAKGTAPETRVSCAVCGADRSSEVDLSRHMKRHRDDRYFCCDICIFRTVQLKKVSSFVKIFVQLFWQFK